MSFLTPWFLIGLGCLAVPVAIHLFHRQQKDPIRFPSLMFLERIPFRTVRRQTLRDPLLFLVRALLVLLLVGAFARPFLGNADISAGESGAREVVILLDRSYSMQYGDRFDRARQQVRDVGATLLPSDAVSLVLFSNEASIPVRSATGGRAHPGRRHRNARLGRDTVSSGAGGGGVHSEGVDTPPARIGAGLRFPARRVAGLGRRTVSSRHARADRLHCRRGEPKRDVG